MDYLKNFKGDERDNEVSTNGPPLIQWFNKSDFHENNLIANGGWGIERTNTFNPPPIGAIETINHNGGKTSEQATATEIRVAIIGYTKDYTRWSLDGKNADQGRLALMVPQFGYDKMNDKHGGHIESGMSMFVCLDVDPSKILYEISLKTYQVADLQRILQQTKLRVQMLAKHLQETEALPAGQTLPLFTQWVTLGTGPTTKEGGVQKGNVTHPDIKWPGQTVSCADLWNKFAEKGPKATVCNALAQWNFVSKHLTPEKLLSEVPSEADMMHFEEMRKELDMMMAGGYKKIYTLAEIAQVMQKPAQLSDGVDIPDESIGSACKKDVGFANSFFVYAKGTYDLTPHDVKKALGINDLLECALTIAEAHEKLKAYQK